MNTNEYIEKYSNIKIDGQIVTVTINVPPRVVVELASQESEATRHILIFTTQVQEYLASKGMTDITVLQPASSDNEHPKGLTATWVFSATSKSSSKRNAKIKNKKIIK